MNMEQDFPDARPAPDGWVMRAWRNTFSAQAGPFYFREEGGPPGVGFFSEPHHANLGGVVHGGMLMTLADMAIFDAVIRKTSFEAGATVTLNSEFIGSGPIGEFIEATGELMKEGGSLLFVRGLVTVKGATIMSFSGSLKRWRSRS